MTVTAINPRTVPYITSWSDEVQGYRTETEWGIAGGRLAYRDEYPGDRDAQGVLWQRHPLARGKGRPMFSKVHAQRQRRCMARLLCQVCGGPATRDVDGAVLWLDGDAGSPFEGTISGAPPTCAACVPVARSLCPHLMRGALLGWVGVPTLWGVYGMGLELATGTWRPGVKLAYGDPQTRLLLAGQILMRLDDVRMIDDVPDPAHTDV